MERRALSRRQFMGNTGSLVGGAALASLLGSDRLRASPPGEELRVPSAVLGRIKVEVSRLGVGCAPFQYIAVDEVEKILERALELGVNYLDTAPNYGNEEIGFSEEKMGPALRRIRDRVFLVTKTEEPTYEGTWKLLRQSLKRLQTDRLDLVHLHNFGNEERFPDLKLVLGRKGALGALQEAKEKGVVRFIGASGHLHPSRFHAALDTGQIDVLMNAVNYVVQHTYSFERKVWSRAQREDLGLVAMKVLGGARDKSFRLPEERYEAAIRYALSIPGISLAVIGLKSIGELEMAARTIAAFKPLSPDEAHTLATEGLELAADPDWRNAYGKPL